jgi:CheY-like chemotaxis protein
MDTGGVATVTPSRPVLPFILVADDNSDARDIYSTYFEYSGFRVATAADGREVVAKTREQRPDVVLMDLSMPGMDGWQAAKILRADPATRNTIIVALTGHALKGSERIALEAGCDRYLIKPCLPEDAVAAVRAILSEGVARRRLA